MFCSPKFTEIGPHCAILMNLDVEFQKCQLGGGPEMSYNEL